MTSLHVRRCFLVCCLISVISVMSVFANSNSSLLQVPPPPRLDGRHFRITVVEQPGFVDFYTNGSLRGGYCVDILQMIANHANFTYEFLPPSGLGSLCQQEDPNVTQQENTIIPYAETYRSQYLCGQSDVNDWPILRSNNIDIQNDTTTTNNITNLPVEYATDMYLGLFYVTPERQLQNQFTMAYHPPTTGALTLFGTAIRIQSMDDLIQQQQQGIQKPVCVQVNTAFKDYVEQSLPKLQLQPYDPKTMGDYYQSFASRTCDIQISDNPIATRFILEQQRQRQCNVQGMPFGIITSPLSYGFSQYAIGIRKDMEPEVVEAIDYWMNILMTCSPNEPTCDSFSQLYPTTGGTGRECGYVAFPPTPPTVPERLLSRGAIAGLAISLLAIMVMIMYVLHLYRLRKQRRRYKKRFVQQIARNIQIGPTPRHIPAEKLAEEIEHISSSTNGIIHKDDLKKWMFDIKLNFLSDEDFEALWNAIDVDRRGVVEPLEFFVFLSLCGPEFETVYRELSNMPKSERLKWASRRLTNYKLRGEAGVRKMEHDLERRSRQNVVVLNQTRGSHDDALTGMNPRGSSLDTFQESGSPTVTDGTQQSKKKRWLPGLPYGPPIDESTTPTEFFTTYNRSPEPSPQSSISSLRSTTAPPHSMPGGNTNRESDASSTIASLSFDQDLVREVPLASDNASANRTTMSIPEPIDEESSSELPEVRRTSNMSAMSEMTHDA